jgi:hypothetical protein
MQTMVYTTDCLGHGEGWVVHAMMWVRLGWRKQH